MTDGAARVEVVLAGGDVLGGDVGVGLDAPLRVDRRQPPLRQILCLNRYGARQENSRREGDREAGIRYSAKHLDQSYTTPDPRLPTSGAAKPPTTRAPPPTPDRVTSDHYSNPARRRGKTHLSANNQDQRALLTPARACRSAGPNWPGRSAGSAPSARFRWGYIAPPQGIRKRSSEVPPRRPTAGRSPAPDARLTSPPPRPREPHNV